jgi:dihydrodipicolinate synthase/N-acetylneuraminate lyase
MDQKTLRERLYGCYVTIPTMFHDDDEFSLNLDAMQEHVRFLLDGGMRTGTGVLLAGGAAGDFSTMTFDERVAITEAVVEAADGKIPVIMGAQTTSTKELVNLLKAAERVGAEYVQVSPPYYFAHTEGDFYDFILEGSEAADIGLIVYNTFWTTPSVSMGMVDKLVELPNLAGLKWSVPGGGFGMERIVQRFSDRVSVIDNMGAFVATRILGARSIEIHAGNYWPQWAVSFLHLLEEARYTEAQNELMRVLIPFYDLWGDMQQYTSGDGYADKLCMELVGLQSSRCRPPTRDVRDQFREQARQMLIQVGAPGLVE